MPTENDGTLDIPMENQTMNQIDLPSNVASQLMTESVGNIQGTNANSREDASLAHSVLRFAAARNFDELGAAESRAVGAVMATPIASPTTQQVKP